MFFSAVRNRKVLYGTSTYSIRLVFNVRTRSHSCRKPHRCSRNYQFQRYLCVSSLRWGNVCVRKKQSVHRRVLVTRLVIAFNVKVSIRNRTYPQRWSSTEAFIRQSLDDENVRCTFPALTETLPNNWVNTRLKFFKVEGHRLSPIAQLHLWRFIAFQNGPRQVQFCLS